MPLAWTFEHSIDCAVTPDFAWNFWTNVNNWSLDADVNFIEIDGPFAAGARGFTNSKSSGRVDWRIPGAGGGSAVLGVPLSGGFPLPGPSGRFGRTFEDKGRRTKTTQRDSLDGEQADLYAKAVAPSLETGI